MFSLANVKKANRDWRPIKALIYSVQGLGKSTLASTFEKPIFLRAEDGANNLDVDTFPEIVSDETTEGGLTLRGSGFTAVENAIAALHGEHDYKTFVVDSLDWLEPLVWSKLIQMVPFSDKGKEIFNIEDYGYGKGFNLALDWWRYLMGGFDSLCLNKGMNIILIAHSAVKRYDSPESDPFDRYGIKLHKGAFELWQEWADMVLFCNYKTKIHKTDVGFGKDVKRGEGSGERVLYTEERPAFLAKNRWSLPSEIYIGKDKTFGAFHKALHESTNGRYKMPGENK